MNQQAKSRSCLDYGEPPPINGAPVGRSAGSPILEPPLGKWSGAGIGKLFLLPDGVRFLSPPGSASPQKEELV